MFTTPTGPVAAASTQISRDDLLSSAAVPRGSRSNQLQVTMVPVDQLRPDPGNPRRHPKSQIKQIARSIETFGFNVPLLVRQDGTIIAGHACLLALRQLGWTEAPVIYLHHLTSERACAFQIAHNQLSTKSDWDERLLGEALRDLSLESLDFSLDVTGFSMAEIDLRIEGLDVVDAAKLDRIDAVPPAAGSAVSRTGDVWMLGQHRVLCGNSLEAESYRVLLNGDTAAVAFTDPPYNVRISGHVCGLGAVQHREFAMASGEMSEAEFEAFLVAVVQILATHCRDGALLYVCMDWRHMAEVLAAGRAAGLEFKNVCVWAKDNAGMGSLYRSQHEFVFVYKKGSAPHRNNVELGKHGRHRTNVWRYPGVNSFGRKGEEGNLLALHPTVKPVTLVADALLDCSARGDLVLDPFLGSGTTLMAAERVGRRCAGIEMDPLYVDTIIRRWSAFTGENAVHAHTGMSFAEIVEARAAMEQGAAIATQEDHHGR